MADPAAWAQWIQLKPRHLAAVSLACGSAVFLPPAAIQRLGLAGLLASHRGWLGGAFIGATALLLTHASAGAWTWLKARRATNTKNETRVNRLRALTPLERTTLARFMAGRTRSEVFHAGDGAIDSLITYGVLRQASHSSNLYRGSMSHYAYHIEDWAWEYLNAHPEVLAVELVTPAPPA